MTEATTEIEAGARFASETTGPGFLSCTRRWPHPTCRTVADGHARCRSFGRCPVCRRRVGIGVVLLSLRIRRRGRVIRFSNPSRSLARRSCDGAFILTTKFIVTGRISALDSDFLDSLGGFENRVLVGRASSHRRHVVGARQHPATGSPRRSVVRLDLQRSGAADARGGSESSGLTTSRVPFGVGFLLHGSGLYLRASNGDPAGWSRRRLKRMPEPPGAASRGRGMDQRHDLVDWVGGYPFEVAKPEQVFDAVHLTASRSSDSRRVPVGSAATSSSS